MKTIKKADTIIQACTLLAAITVAVYKTDYIFHTYIFTAFIQLTSIVLHHINGWCRNKTRNIFQYTMYSLVLLALLTVALPVLLIVWIGLLFITPFMSVAYLWLCFDESWHRLNRPLSILK